MNIEIRATNQIPKVELDHMNGWVAQVFAGSDDQDMQWSTDDWHVTVRVDGQVVSRVGIVERMGAVNGTPVKLGGIGGVATRPEFRRCGYAEAALRTAAEFMRAQLRVEFGLLICGDKMIHYYGKLGWQIVPGPMQFDQPQGKVTFTDTVMILPCNARDWPPGVIDLCGPPW
jgi:ribosomal protein S18 acetylase RimI-like enzyme